MALIFSASTSLGAPNHTSYLLRPLFFWLDPHMSEETFARCHYLVRKAAHFTEYAILGMLIWRTLRHDPAFRSCTTTHQFWLALLLAAFYASTDEFHQKFVPTREPSVQDVLLDTCGAGAGLLFIWSARRLGLSQGK
jgi:VanZ family protein